MDKICKKDQQSNSSEFMVESIQLADMSNGDMEDMCTSDTADHGNDARQHIHTIYSVQVIQADLACTSTVWQGRE